MRVSIFIFDIKRLAIISYPVTHFDVNPYDVFGGLDAILELLSPGQDGIRMPSFYLHDNQLTPGSLLSIIFSHNSAIEF